MMMRIFLVLFLLSAQSAFAQEFKIKGGFLQDTMSIGQPVQFSLSVSYPSDQLLLFPDSTYDFSPFEYQGKKYFPTETDSLISYDSAVFTLASFEIETLQTLRLPVFVLTQEGDSTAFFTSADTIYLQEMVPVLSDTLSLKTDTALVATESEFNYPLLIASLLALLVLLVLVFIFFGKKIRLKWQEWKLKRKHEKFLEVFRPQVQQPKTEQVEKLLFLWKHHLENISSKPYARLTSKEIYSLHQDEKLYHNLKQMDRSIYSSAKNENLSGAFVFLIDYADQLFNDRIKELQSHGK